MLERIYKLQPNRTMALRGFDNLGASAAMHAATANSFKVTGNFREAADFCVLMLWDVDDFYEHPSIKYLPDPNFAGLVLTFDVQYKGLQPLDSNKFPTIDWPYLDVLNMDGTTAQINLFAHATQVGGNYTAASSTFTLVGPSMQQFDRVTLWYQNFAFDHIVAAGETISAVVTDLVHQINNASYGVGGIGLSAAALPPNQFVVTAAKAGVDGNMIRLYQINKNPTLQITPNSANLTGGDSGAVWRVTLDFSALGITNIRKLWLTFAPPLANGQTYAGNDWEANFTNWTLTGPENVKALQVAGLNSIRIQQSSTACTYSGNWSQVQKYGFYDQGFAQRATSPPDGSVLGSTARIRYSCAVRHDVYIGTLLAGPPVDAENQPPAAGVAGIQLDGDAETDLNCALLNTDVVVTRRKVRSNVPAGPHVLTMVHKSGPYVDFNFLEAAVPYDIPAPLPTRTNLSPALDFDTDHTYKLPPARILWILNQLGFSGPINEYLGVFWWNQRTNVGGAVPSLSVTFGGTWAQPDGVFLRIGPPDPNHPGQIDPTKPDSVTTITKSVFPADTLDTIAAHFAAFINEVFSGIWASVTGSTLTLTCRSASYSFAMDSQGTSTTAGTITFNGILTNGALGQWWVDPTQSPTLNTGARAWHTDFYNLCKAGGLDVVTAISMELVYPPSNYPAQFHDGSPVGTATGFGTYVSNHCAIGGPILDFQKTVISDIAALQTTAGLIPCIQLGEFLWWYFSGPPAPSTPLSMAYYDAQTQAAAIAALGRTLYVFATPNDDPQVNGAADATFLRNRLRDHVSTLFNSLRTAYPTARCEILLPLDVNYPEPVGPVGEQVGGQLNHFVNIPPEWLSSTTAGFDFLKIEALAFGSTRDLDLAESAIEFILPTSWPGHARRYLVPVFGTASPWPKEMQSALAAGNAVVNFWALDHICLYGWSVTASSLNGATRSTFQG